MAVNQKLIDALARGLRHSRPDGIGPTLVLGTADLKQWETDVHAVQLALNAFYGWHFQWAKFSDSVRRPKGPDEDGRR